jgi:hypothetical protein
MGSGMMHLAVGNFVRLEKTKARVDRLENELCGCVRVLGEEDFSEYMRQTDAYLRAQDAIALKKHKR